MPTPDQAIDAIASQLVCDSLGLAPFFDNLESFVELPEGVEKLRELVLGLAVRGQLVPQDPNDEPASVDSLGNLLRENSLNGYSKKPSDTPEGTQVLRISAGTSRGDFYVEETDHKWSVLTDAEREKFNLQKDDLLACRFNGNLHYVGKFSLYRNELGTEQIYPDKLIRFRVDRDRLVPRYAAYALNAQQSRQKIESFCATTAGNIGISATNLKTIEMLVPPLAEQKRIVSKVSVLLSQLDELSARLRSRQSTTDALLTALIHQILAGTK